MNIIFLGNVAEAVLRRAIRNNPQEMDALVEAIEDVFDGREESVTLFPEKQDERYEESVHIMANPETDANMPTGAILIQGSIETIGADVEMQEGMAVLGSRVPAAARQLINNGILAGKPLSQLILHGLECDPTITSSCEDDGLTIVEYEMTYRGLDAIEAVKLHLREAPNSKAA